MKWGSGYWRRKNLAKQETPRVQVYGNIENDFLSHLQKQETPRVKVYGNIENDFLSHLQMLLHGLYVVLIIIWLTN